MKKYCLTVADRSVNFICREDEQFDAALSRAAARLGYRGGAWTQPNFHMSHQVTVTDRAARGSNSRASYNGMACAL